MANQDRPRGFWPIRHLTGGEIRTHRYPVGGTVYAGDVVKLQADGTVIAATANDDPLLGVAVTYAAAADADPKVSVVHDPFVIYGAQASGSIVAADVGTNANHVAGSGATYSVGYDPYHSNLDGNSAHEIGTAGASAASFRIIGLVDRPDNAWGTNADVEVMLVESFMLPGADDPHSI